MITFDATPPLVVDSGQVSVVLGAAPISITSDYLFTLLRSWILSVLESDIPVVRGQDNRVPEPQEDDWIEITPGGRTRLATNSDRYLDPVAIGGLPPYASGQRIVCEPTQIDIQVDVHGPCSSDNVARLEALFRDFDACEFFANLNPAIQPLYSSDPKQLAFINDSEQFEDRWSIDFTLQANIEFTRPQTFAASLAVLQTVITP